MAAMFHIKQLHLSQFFNQNYCQVSNQSQAITVSCHCCIHATNSHQLCPMTTMSYITKQLHLVCVQSNNTSCCSHWVVPKTKPKPNRSQPQVHPLKTRIKSCLYSNTEKIPLSTIIRVTVRFKLVINIKNTCTIIS